MPQKRYLSCRVHFASETDGASDLVCLCGRTRTGLVPSVITTTWSSHAVGTGVCSSKSREIGPAVSATSWPAIIESFMKRRALNLRLLNPTSPPACRKSLAVLGHPGNNARRSATSRPRWTCGSAAFPGCQIIIPGLAPPQSSQTLRLVYYAESTRRQVEGGRCHRVSLLRCRRGLRCAERSGVN